jgi:hypothetical protein
MADWSKMFGGLGLGGMQGLASRRQPAQSGLPQFDPNNPYGWMTGDTQANASGNYNRLLGPAIQGGMFNPGGNEFLMNALRSDAQRQSLGRGRSALNFARNNGIDPSAMGFAGLMAQLGSQSDLADSLLNARMQSGLQNQNFFQNLLGQGIQNDWNWRSNDQMYKINQGLAQARPKTDWGAVAGQLGGAALGAMIPNNSTVTYKQG